MSFQVRTEQRETSGLYGTVYVLSSADGSARAEVWPAFGFNCYLWKVLREDVTLDLLYSDPQLFHGSKPTRSGIPILFPFPNRIRGGCFTWDGKQYQLPRNDSSGQNAIHGFACWHPWRVVDQGADDKNAWVTGEFQAPRDAPETISLWPADYRLRVRYRLSASRLRIEAEIDNMASQRLPFGLGYHPYYRLPFLPGTDAADYLMQAYSWTSWELEDSLPTGEQLSTLDTNLDFPVPRRVGEITADDVLTNLLGAGWVSPEPLFPRGLLATPGGQPCLTISASGSFRELVLFTPPHRQAVALEPYTCTTDAINLEQRNIDAGLRVLSPGQKWIGIVELAVE